MKQFYSLIIMIPLVCSCALIDQQVTLKSDANVTPTDIGKGRVVKLKTVDERTSSTIGHRSLGGAGSSAEITTTQDVLVVIQTALLDGLKHKGFSPNLGEGSAQRGLRVEIRNLEYSLTPGIILNYLRTEAVLKATCTVEGKESYDKIYRGEEKDRVFFPQFAGENVKYINSALSKVVQNLFDDSKLQECLAQ